MPRTSHSTERFIDADACARLVGDGATLYVTGVGGALAPRYLMAALERRFIADGHPGELTLIGQANVGGRGQAEWGMDSLAREGMLKRFINSGLYPDWNPNLAKQILDGPTEGYLLPMGTIIHWLRATGDGRPGLHTQVGLGTYVDPRVEGPGLNAASTAPLSQVVEIAGEEYLFHPAPDLDFVFIKGSYADEAGNVSLEHEPFQLNVRSAALAARARGGRVIVQVGRQVKRHSIDPHLVGLPASLVDHIVVAPEQAQLEGSVAFDPRLSGEERAASFPVQPSPLDAEKVIARRALMLVGRGEVFNCGFRIPQQRIPHLTLEEDVADLVTVSVEHGVLGGHNPGGIFHYNPDSWLTGEDVMDAYHGGYLDYAFLQFLQSDGSGNVNVTRLGRQVYGPGGAIDIAHSVPTVVFCGTLATGGLELEIGDGALRIVQDGKHSRFVETVEQVTFAAPQFARKGQTMLFVTERALLRRGPGESALTVMEVAPGIDLERDVLARIPFETVVSPELRTMDAAIFCAEPMGLRARLGGTAES